MTIQEKQTLTGSDCHLTTHYIVKDNNGALHLIQYRPTENFRHWRTSANDLWATQVGVYMETPGHDYWKGDVIICRRVVMAAWGLQTIENIEMTVLAKHKFIWDYGKPLGERKVWSKKTQNWESLHQQLKAQKK